MDWKGIRVYLKVNNIATSGPMFDAFRSQIAKSAGEEAANMIHAAVSFEVPEVRPLIDMGQEWESSISFFIIQVCFPRSIPGDFPCHPV